MRLRRRRPPVTDEPRGVRIVHADGSVSECALVRDPDNRRGCAQWLAEPPPGTVFVTPVDVLQVDFLPGRTGITIACTMGIKCPVCGMVSCHAEDVRQGFCGNCHDWTAQR